MQKVPHYVVVEELQLGSLQNSRLLLLILILLASCADSLKVTVPANNLIAARGYSVVLGCVFSPDFGENPDLSDLLVTWQRQATVVHSFYFGRDQLDEQSSAYHNRTELFVTELSKGNASLKIENVGVNDAGLYLCTISTNQGTDKAELQLDYGALYTEPRLTVKVNSSEVWVQYKTHGYPKPEVKWAAEPSEQLGNNIQTSAQLNKEEGLYYIQSSYTAPNLPLNLTFILENQLLHQYIQRPINYSGDHNSCFKKVVVLSVTSVLLLAALIASCICYCKTKKRLK